MINELKTEDIVKILKNGIWLNGVNPKKTRPTKQDIVTLSLDGIVIIYGMDSYEPSPRLYKWSEYGKLWAFTKSKLEPFK